MNYSLKSLFIFLFISSLNSKAENDSLRYTDHTYRPSIKTVILQQEGVDGSIPMIELGSGTRLHLQFDDLDPIQRQFYYSLEHCNADWKPSRVMISRAIKGLQQDFLQDFEYSFNTRQQFIHYSLLFPNEQMEILLSGNYIIKVFEDGDPDNIVLTRRFMVFKQDAQVGANVRRTIPVNLMDTHQEVDVTVGIGSLSLVNIPATTHLIIRQNGRWDNAIHLKPFSFNKQNINYNYDDGRNCFEAGNEFRWADVRSLRMQSDRVANFQRDSDLVVTNLLLDPIRTFDNYRNLNESNGKFFIRNTDGSEPELDADYTWVKFTLPFEAPVNNGNLFIFGALSDWNFKDEFKLVYDYPSKSYRARILLKQGIYNYSYVFLPKKSSKGDVSYIEGSHFETENDYLILFYTRQYTEVFDELSGMSQINSRGIR
jgi:hypothetical protein